MKSFMLLKCHSACWVKDGLWSGQARVCYCEKLDIISLFLGHTKLVA